MVNIKNIGLIIFIAAIAAVSDTSAQRCGSSINRIHIYVRNGVTLVNPRYELISITPTALHYGDIKLAQFISKTFLSTDREPEREFWRVGLSIIKAEPVEKFLKNYKFEEYDPDPRWRRLEKKNFTGPVTNGLISFPTGEAYDYPYILKIFGDNRTPVYVLGAHLGGCSSRERIVIDETDARAYRENPEYDYEQ